MKSVPYEEGVGNAVAVNLQEARAELRLAKSALDELTRQLVDIKATLRGEHDHEATVLTEADRWAFRGGWIQACVSYAEGEVARVGGNIVRALDAVAEAVDTSAGVRDGAAAYTVLYWSTAEDKQAFVAALPILAAQNHPCGGSIEDDIAAHCRRLVADRTAVPNVA